MKTSEENINNVNDFESFLKPIIENGFEGMSQVIAVLMNEAMKIERARHIGAFHN